MSGTTSNNTIINNSIEGYFFGIHIQQAATNMTISGNSVTNATVGIDIQIDPSNSPWVITNNVLTGNLLQGLYLSGVSESDISHNIIQNNGREGILANGNPINNNTISFNSINNNGRIEGKDGLQVWGADNKILNNTIHDNGNTGIQIGISGSDGNLIANNSVMRNFRGIALPSSDNVVKHNLVFGHRFQAIYITNILNNVTLNDLVANYYGSSGQIWLSDLNNRVEGNFFSDWVGPDTNNDQIVDVPYQLEFTGTDPLPRTLPASSWGFDLLGPFLNSPDDLTYEISLNSQSIGWGATTTETSTYTIYQNSSVIATGNYGIGDLATIELSLGVLSIGIYNYTIVLEDGSDRTAKDTIFVNITNESDAPTLVGIASTHTIVTGEEYTLTWSASDVQPDIYELYIDEVVNNTGTWSSDDPVSFDLSTLNPGVYNFTIVFYDLNGLSVAQVVTVTVNADVLAPTVSTSQSTITINHGQNAFNIEWQVFDINLVNYVVYKDNVQVDAGLFNSDSESIYVSLDGLAVGVYNYTLVAADAWGNMMSGTVTVTILFVPDTSAPVITLDAGDTGFTEGATEFALEYRATDENPDFYTILQDGVQVATGQWVSDELIRYSLAGLAVGSYAFQITFYDDNGLSTSAFANVTVTPQDSTDPDETTSTTPSDTSSFTDPPPPDDDAGTISSISTFMSVISLSVIVILRKRQK